MGRFFPLLAAIVAFLCVPTRQESRGPEKRSLKAKAGAAAAEKLIEVGGQLIDEQLAHMKAAGENARSFLHDKIHLDITPDMTFESDNAHLPEGYHLTATVEHDDQPQNEAAAPSYVYPVGLGPVLMNGCFGRDYKRNDPCFQVRRGASYCQDMVDGAALLGSGFDGNGDYNPEGRKMSLVQRNCANKAIYEGYTVPDAMNVHGIYDTNAYMMTFENKEQYRSHLQTESASAGYGFGFNGGVNKAFGIGLEGSEQVYLAVTNVDIDRYEIFMDEVKPSDLSLSFLRDYLNLPVSYFSPGAQIKYHDFLQRWGTSYVKSAKFGGRLQISKVAAKKHFSSKLAFSESMEFEYNSIFFGGGTRSSSSMEAEAGKQTEFARTSISAQGGSQGVAAILTDMYSPSFKTDFMKWLQSVPEFPKAYSFQLGSIMDLLNFRASDLFAEENIDWGCEGGDLLAENFEDGTTRWYYMAENSTKRYCPFVDRYALDDALQRRRSSLQTAIDIYLSGEDTVSFSKMTIPAIHDCKTEPCNLKWSNAFQLDFRTTRTKTMDGSCIRFVASSAGDFFVAFATLPRERSTWYYVKIGTQDVQIFKGSKQKETTSESAALSLGDDALYQSYFVCVLETFESTLITVGKTPSASNEGDVYLVFIDNYPSKVQFYAFGNNKETVTLNHVSVVQHDRMNFECKGTKTQAYMAHDETKICVPRCHKYCEPLKGCSDPGNPNPSQCHACRFARGHNSQKCLEKCARKGYVAIGQNKECIASYDIKAKVSNKERVPPVNVNPFLTLCLWKKFPGSKPSGAKPNVILRFTSPSLDDVVELRTVPNDSFAYSGELLSEHEGRNLAFRERYLDDNKWHHLCLVSIPSSSHSLTRQVYVDDRYLGEVPLRRRLIIDYGKSTVELLPEFAQEIHLSGLFFWSYPLNGRSVHWLSRSCLNSAYDWGKLNSYIPSSLKATPSSCIAREDSDNKKYSRRTLLRGHPFSGHRLLKRLSQLSKSRK